MDQITLVDEQIADGKRLLDQLGKAGFPVTAAGWVRESDNGRWYLCLASPFVEDQGIGAAYRCIHSLIRRMPQPFWVGPLEVRAIGAHGPIAEAMLDLSRRLPGRSPFRYGVTQLGGVDVESAYIYLPIAIADQPDNQISGVN